MALGHRTGQGEAGAWAGGSGAAGLAPFSPCSWQHLGGDGQGISTLAQGVLWAQQPGQGWREDPISSLYLLPLPTTLPILALHQV